MNRNTIKIDINNGCKLKVYQSDTDKIRGGVSLEDIDSNGKVGRRDLIDEGDFVMLMNYYRYIKDYDIKDDFINLDGKNSREEMENQLL